MALTPGNKEGCLHERILPGISPPAREKMPRRRRGEVATRKVKSLLAAKARVTIVNPQCTGQLQELEKRQPVQLIREAYKEAHLQGTFLVIAASSEREVNQQVQKDCLSRNLLVNVADDPAGGEFFCARGGQ